MIAGGVFLGAGIYAITNVKKNKVYIGQSKNTTKRIRKQKEMLRRGCHFSEELQHDWHECGEEAFVFTVLEKIKDGDKKILTDREEYWIEYFRNETPSETYNKNLGFHPSEAAREKIRQANLGDKNPKYWLGKHRSEETKRKLSEAHKGLQAGEKHPMYGKPGYWKGKKMPKEIREKISEANRRRIITEETRQKLAQLRKGIPGPGKVYPTREMFDDIVNGISQKDFVEKYSYSVNLLKRMKQEIKNGKLTEVNIVK
jgi:group I intron endonuclease